MRSMREIWNFSYAIEDSWNIKYIVIHISFFKHQINPICFINVLENWTLMRNPIPFELRMRTLRRKRNHVLNLKHKLTEYGEAETGARARRSVGGSHFLLLFYTFSLFLFHTILRYENVSFLFFFTYRCILASDNKDPSVSSVRYNPL